MPVKVVDLELSEGLQPIWGMEGYEGLSVLVRHKRQPVGWIYTEGLNQSLVSSECLFEAIRQQIGWQILTRILSGDPDALLTNKSLLTPISVIVCASDRTTQLESCLHALTLLDYPDYETVLVDAVSTSHGHAHLAAKFSIRYVREQRSGLAYARNRGIAEAHHDIIAFIDGDTRPDRNWLRSVSKAFAEPEVKAVTGCVAPAEQETTAQIAFEHGGYGLGRGLRRRTFRGDRLTREDLFWANGFGSGVNMAFRKRVFTEIGPFDTGFRADMPSDGSDIEMFHRLLMKGHTLVYEPAALVWYTPGRDDASLRRLAYEHGRSFGIYLFTCLRNHTVSRSSLLRFVVRDWLGRWFCKRLLRPGKVTRVIVLTELAGALYSPISYSKGATDMRRMFTMTKGDLPCSPGPNGVVWTQLGRSRIRRRRAEDSVSIHVVRTWYPHWGQYSGINRFLQYIDQSRYSITTQLVQENDHDFPIKNKAVRRWLGYWVKRQDMAWYNLSDLTAEMKCLKSYRYKKADVIHYLDGEHSAQFLPKLRKLPRRIRPKLVVSYHQPPEVLDEVIRKDNVSRWDCIVVVAPEQQDFFKALTEPDKVRLVMHGIDTDYFRPVIKPREDEKIRCVTVGHNYRDYKTVRQVAEELIGDRRIEFHVVSPRPTGVEDLSNVTVYQGISDERLLQLYQQADILFLPLIKATANNTLLEAIACGLPVLSTSLPSVEAYLPGKEAILVEDNDPQKFLDAILRLTENPAIRRTMATEARTRAEELDWRNIAPQYEAIYSQLATNT